MDSDQWRSEVVAEMERSRRRELLFNTVVYVVGLLVVTMGMIWCGP